ncbi:wax ester synthase/diacylglycerol acyltransferase 11-like [Zingiber officinale]|uniref:Diacylglycerol O-acyltransferase n=1 Tax=Zingiber officinale TaxID=94328 RepID=A0A8J5L4R0_ZINOF|nr:wax ester synthase/diacylglycerol acyltransferase 11-like [Zingiber officinale]KAG6505928.1 hypothetical protein ZIOFF_031241 [Zingiber officinale]
MESTKRRPPPLTHSRSIGTVVGRSGFGDGAVGGDAAEPVSPAGLLFRHRRFDCYIVAALGIGVPIDVDSVKSGLVSTLVRHPRFSSVLVADDDSGEKLKWVRTKVVIDDHVVVPDLGADSSGEGIGGSASSADEVVEDYVSYLSAAPPMDASRPLWELHVLNLRTSEAAAVAVFRIHHSLGDGLSLISLLLACTRRTADPTSLPTLPQQRLPLPPPPRSNALLTGILFLWALIVLTWNTAADLFDLLASSAWLKDTPTPLKGGAGTELRRKRFVHRTLRLDDVKEIKDSMNCTINDVLVGVTSASISRYLNRRYGEADEGNDSKKELPANIRLRSAMLFNVRPQLGIQALAEMMDGKNCGVAWGNLLSYIILPFPVIMYNDPLDYVRAGKAIAERKKNSLQAILTYRCAHFCVRKFGIKPGVAMIRGLVCNTTLSYSNIVGPVDEVSFYGHPIVYIAPSVYGHPHALTLHYQSYVNEMRVVLGVDESTIPDSHQLLADIVESIKLIKEALPKKL